MNIFLAGATGAIGRRLAPLLLDAGHQVVLCRTSREDAVWGGTGFHPRVVKVELLSQGKLSANLGRTRRTLFPEFCLAI